MKKLITIAALVAFSGAAQAADINDFLAATDGGEPVLYDDARSVSNVPHGADINDFLAATDGGEPVSYDNDGRSVSAHQVGDSSVAIDIWDIYKDFDLD